MSVTLVTCYYRVNSKHPVEDYNKWIHNFIPNFYGNLVIYTSSDLVDYFNPLIKDKNIKLIVKNITDLTIYKKYEDIWDEQKKKDIFCSSRTKECYILWNSKFDLLKEVIETNPFRSEKFIWNDIGNVRDLNHVSILKNYPKYDSISNNQMDIALINPFNNKPHFFQNSVHLSGSIFGSDKQTILILHKLFYEMFDIYLKNDKFIGCDQQILNSVYCNCPNLFNLIDHRDTKHNIPSWVDPWFCLYSYYSK
jgi:hypothetical protein